MEEFPVVDIENRGLWFDIFYLLAFLVAFLLLLYQGRKKAYPQLPWLLMVASGWLLFVLGCKLLTYSADEWREAFVTYTLPVTSGMTILGGLLLGMTGLLAGRWWGRLPWASLDIFAWVLPVSVVIQHIGCFVVGCCHGKVTGVAWAVSYPANTLPHHHQLNAGLIDHANTASLPVHPTQIYEIIAALMVLLLVLHVRKFLRAPGNLFLSYLLFFSCFRFFTEFFKAYTLAIAGNSLFWGMNLVQWSLLIFSVLAVAILLYREWVYQEASDSTPVNFSRSLSHNLLYLLLMVTVFWSLSSWLMPREIIVLNIAFLPVIAVAAYQLFHTYTQPGFRWQTVALLLLPLMLMSQTIPADSAYLKTYNTISLGYGTGNYFNSRTYYTPGPVDASGCGGNTYNTEHFKQEYSILGIGFAKTKEHDRYALTYGLNAFGGSHRETVWSSGNEDKKVIIGLNPYISYDRPYYGFGGGFHLGSLIYTPHHEEEEKPGLPTTAIKRTPLFPQAHLRLGPKNIIFLNLRMADQFPSALPGLQFQYSVGSGFGLKNGTNFQFGGTGLGHFMSAYVLIQDRVALESLYHWRPDPWLIDNTKHGDFALGLHYRFGHQVRGKK